MKMIGKHFTETSNKVVLRINRVQIYRARPVIYYRDAEMKNSPLWIKLTVLWTIKHGIMWIDLDLLCI